MNVARPLLAALFLVAACDRPMAPVAEPAAPSAAPVVPDGPVALEVNGLRVTRAQLEARVPQGADTATVRRDQDEVIDLLLAASEARHVAPYDTLPPLEAGARFLDDQFAPERFCAALPEAELKRYYRAHRTRYVHPDHHVVAALRATPDASPATTALAAELDEALTLALDDAGRVGADAFELLSLRWEAAARAAGATPTTEAWTFLGVPDHPERTPPARLHPEDTAAIVGLVEGQRSPVTDDDDGVRVYVKLEGHRSARRDLGDPGVRDEVRRRACNEHLQEAKRAWLDDLRRIATVVISPPNGPTAGPR